MAGRAYMEGSILGQGFAYDATNHISLGGFNSFNLKYSGDTVSIPIGNEEAMTEYDFTLGKKLETTLVFNQTGPDTDAAMLGYTIEGSGAGVKTLDEEQTVAAGAITLDNTPLLTNTDSEGVAEVYKLDSNNDKQYYSRVAAAPTSNQMVVTASPAGIEFNVDQNDVKVYTTYWYTDADVIYAYDEPGQTPNPIELMVEMRWVRPGEPDGQITYYFKKATPKIDQERGAGNKAHSPVTVNFSIANEVEGDVQVMYWKAKKS